MATSEFERVENGTQVRYTPGKLLYRHDKPHLVWSRRELRDNAWVLQGTRFVRQGRTRAQVADAFVVEQVWP